MIEYKGKCKCSCGKRASFKAQRGHQNFYACVQHKDSLNGKHKPFTDSGRMTEADYQTWWTV